MVIDSDSIIFPIKLNESEGSFLKINSVGIAPPSIKNCEYNLQSFSILEVIINSYLFSEIGFTEVVKVTGSWEYAKLIENKTNNKLKIPLIKRLF